MGHSNRVSGGAEGNTVSVTRRSEQIHVLQSLLCEVGNGRIEETGCEQNIPKILEKRVQIGIYEVGASGSIDLLEVSTDPVEHQHQSILEMRITHACSEFDGIQFTLGSLALPEEWGIGEELGADVPDPCFLLVRA